VFGVFGLFRVVWCVLSVSNDWSRRDKSKEWHNAFQHFQMQTLKVCGSTTSPYKYHMNDGGSCSRIGLIKRTFTHLTKEFFSDTVQSLHLSPL